MSSPRKELEEIGDRDLIKVLHPISWPVVKERIRMMDFCAFGDESSDATLIAALAVKLYEASVG